jgi:hypothetical protein
MLGRAHNLDTQIEQFEAENQVFYTTIDDEFKAAPKKEAKPTRQKPHQTRKRKEDVQPITVPRQTKEPEPTESDEMEV